MRINERLNLVLTVDRGDGSTAYVHAMPIRRDVFDLHFLVLTKTLTSMYAQGFGPGTCQRMAARMLREVSKTMGVWDGPMGVQATLMIEIRRLANAILPSSNGWETMPYEDAISSKRLDEDDIDGVENALVFFTAASWVHSMKELGDEIYPMLETSSLNSTAFTASLRKSTEAESSGEIPTTPLASVPS
jgi:hypothetical protein